MREYILQQPTVRSEFVLPKGHRLVGLSCDFRRCSSLRPLEDMKDFITEVTEATAWIDADDRRIATASLSILPTSLSVVDMWRFKTPIESGLIASGVTYLNHDFRDCCTLNLHVEDCTD